MKPYFSQRNLNTQSTEEDFTPIKLMDSIEKTRRDLEIAYAGFDYAIETDLIDSYIYEINSLQMRYRHLTSLVPMESEPENESLHKHASIRTLVGQVFG